MINFSHTPQNGNDRLPKANSAYDLHKKTFPGPKNQTHRNDQQSCPKCMVLQKRYKKLSASIASLRRQHSSSLEQIQLLIANFSYILELVSQNIEAKVAETLQVWKDKQQSLLLDQRNKANNNMKDLIRSHHQQITAFQQTIKDLNKETSLQIQPAQKPEGVDSQALPKRQSQQFKQNQFLQNFKIPKSNQNWTINSMNGTMHDIDQKDKYISNLKQRLQEIKKMLDL